MLPKEDLADQITDAYEHLYDLVYLRSHPLVDSLVPDRSSDRKERAWKLHNLLLETIEELNPGPQAPAYSHEWRRYKLMLHRYDEAKREYLELLRGRGISLVSVGGCIIASCTAGSGGKAPAPRSAS